MKLVFETSVGIIGMGKVGQAVTRAVRNLGSPVKIYNRTVATAVDVAQATGAVVAPDITSLARDCEIVISCLAGPTAVSDCYFGDEGMVAGLSDRSLVLETTMLAPDTVAMLARGVEEAGARFLCASVTGRPSDLERGAGYLMTSGSRSAFDEVLPLLEVLGRVRHLGDDPTQAAIMKLLVNLCVFSTIGSTGEALAIAVKSDIPREIAYDILLESPVGSEYLRLRREAFLHPEGRPAVTATLGAAVDNYALIVDLARKVGVDAAQAEATKNMMIAACDAGWAADDATTLASFVRESAQDMSLTTLSREQSSEMGTQS